MALFSKKADPVLGIDISSTAVKLIELRQGSGRYRVESYAAEPLPQNAVVEKNIANLEAVSECIRSALRRSHTKLREAAVAVPSSSAISKVISVQSGLSEDEMEAQVTLQANQYIPYPLEEVNLDFQILGPSRGRADETDVLLVASRSENVDVRVDALQSAGITARVVDVESYAVENAFGLMAPELQGGEEQTVGVVDVGATMTTLTVIEQGRILYTREQVFGGRQLTDEVMRRYDYSYEEAGRRKRAGDLPESYEQEVLAPFLDMLAQQVMRSLQFFYGASQHNSVDHVLLAGGCAVIPGAVDTVREQVGVPVTVANPFANMSVASRVHPQALAEDAPSLLIATGLATRSFD